MGLYPVTVHVRQTGGGKNAAPRTGHGFQVNIGRKNLDAVLVKRRAELLGKQNSQRISLLPRGAARHPNTDVVTRALTDENARHDLLQSRKRFGIPEKRGHGDQNVFAQLVQFTRTLINQGQVIRQCAHMVGRHAPLNTPPQCGFFVLRKIYFGAPPHFGQQCLQRGWGIGGLRGHGDATPVLHDETDLGPHILGGQNPVDAAGVDGRLWHAVVFGRGRVLGEGKTTGRFDGVNARGTVRPSAGQNNADARLGCLIGQRGKKQVHRRLGQRLLGRDHQSKAPQVQRYVAIRRSDVDGVGFGSGAVFNVPHGHGGLAPQQMRHHAAVGGRKVLHHHIAQPQIFWQIGE